jgi:AcrR family transcriptional regulator
MLHYYYRTKEQLFECVIDKNVSLIIATMVSSLGKADMPFLDRLKVSISSHFDIVASNPLLPHFFLNEIISRPERYNMMQNKLETSAKEIFSKVQIEIDEQSKQGNIEWIDARMLFMSIVSLNLFPFIALPFAKRMMGDLLDNQDSFLEQRKAENIETIMRRLKKQ